MVSGESGRHINWARIVSAWGPVIVYMACIFFASAQTKMPLEDKTTLSDKTVHALAYLGLALLAYRAVLMAPLRRRLDLAGQAFAVAVLYGVFDEVHQYFVPGRQSDIHDWLADVAGTSIAVAAIILIRTLTNKGGIRSDRRREKL